MRNMCNKQAQVLIITVTVGAGDAEVLLENGSRSFMRDLRLGAKVPICQCA